MTVPDRRQFIRKPQGYFVYILWGEDGNAVYVGQSTNVLSRIGYHMSKDKSKLTATEHVELIRCDDRDDMNTAEISLIRKLKPALNILHHPEADRECYRRSEAR
jgi:predicted GIY-YIG superfamily endonuclease